MAWNTQFSVAPLKGAEQFTGNLPNNDTVHTMNPAPTFTTQPNWAGGGGGGGGSSSNTQSYPIAG